MKTILLAAATALSLSLAVPAFAAAGDAGYEYQPTIGGDAGYEYQPTVGGDAGYEYQSTVGGDAGYEYSTR
ncbi:MAG TPA: hypothetical protein VL154_02565 [Acetobacteraceae bacterium]|nr:hypothetical protein [Acetobacteraceae bacterium]